MLGQVPKGAHSKKEHVGSLLTCSQDKPSLGVKYTSHWLLPGRDVTWGKAALSRSGTIPGVDQLAAISYHLHPPALPLGGGMRPLVLKGHLGDMPQRPLPYPTEIDVEMEI